MAVQTKASILGDFRLELAKAKAMGGGLAPLWPAPYGEDSVEALVSFVTECCWTLDEETGRIEQIPNLPHVRFICQRWYQSRATGKYLMIEKSRRLLASWVLSACELWSLGIRQETRIVCGIDYAKTAQQVWRTAHLYRQAAFRKFPGLDDCTPRGGNYTAQDVREVLLPNGSFIKGLNQETDTFQGSGYAGIRMEELSHYKHVAGMLGQAHIITHGRADVVGGHVVGVCNAYPNPEWQEAKAIKEVLENNDPTWVI